VKEAGYFITMVFFKANCSQRANVLLARTLSSIVSMAGVCPMLAAMSVGERTRKTAFFLVSSTWHDKKILFILIFWNF
jgi:hypothetical protein